MSMAYSDNYRLALLGRNPDGTPMAPKPVVGPPAAASATPTNRAMPQAPARRPPRAAKDASVLSSDWTGLSPHLLARFYPVERIIGPGGKTTKWRRVAGSKEVQAPITDATLDSSFNWHSPFENSGADQQFSAISALLQTGALTPLLVMFQQFVETTPAAGLLGGVADRAKTMSQSLEGRTSMTKLNSTQVFNGMPPMKLSLTAHFRALSDARSEVDAPLSQLMRWALPQELAQDGPVLELAKMGDPSLYPSKIPQIIGMQYANMQMLPLVIEACPYPVSGPRDRNGTLLSAQVSMQLASLAAIDEREWVQDWTLGRG